MVVRTVYADDAVAEARCEALDLGDDRLGGVTRVSVGHMRVRPDRVNVRRRSAAGRPGTAVRPSTNGRSGIRPAWMSRSVAASSAKLPTTWTVPAAVRARVGPGDAAFYREVHLERTGALPESPVGARNPRRQAIAEDSCDGFGGQVEHRHVGGRQL